MPLDPVEVEYCSVCSCPLEYCANAGCERVKLEKEMEGASISAGDGGKDDAAPTTDAPATDAPPPATERRRRRKRRRPRA
jgi:hypothetical protein